MRYMNSLEELTKALTKFRDDRDWEQFHNAKDLAVALNVEASELLELFLWKNANEADEQMVADELADVFAYALMLADHYKLDVHDILSKKIEKNAIKYPVEKAKGTATKYSDL